ncbi:MAG: hypothetical protein AB9828_03275 [Sphaerochaetaceae bacterium]
METDDKRSMGFQRVDIFGLQKKFLPNTVKWLPKPLLRKVSKIIHLEEINDLLQQHFEEQPGEFLYNIAQWLDIKLDIVNEQRLVDSLDQRPVIVGNHPLGGPESILLMEQVVKRRPDMFMISQEMLRVLKPVVPLLVSIPTSNDRPSVNRFIHTFASDSPVLLFPAGYCSRPLSFGDVYDYAWHKTFVSMARKHKRPIVPVFISGSNSKKFYRLGAIRKFLHIKLSVETMYLVDEMMRQRGGQLTMVVGEPILPEMLDHAISDDEWSNRIRQYVYALKTNPKAAFDPQLPATLPLK